MRVWALSLSLSVLFKLPAVPDCSVPRLCFAVLPTGILSNLFRISRERAEPAIVIRQAVSGQESMCRQAACHVPARSCAVGFHVLGGAFIVPAFYLPVDSSSVWRTRATHPLFVRYCRSVSGLTSLDEISLKPTTVKPFLVLKSADAGDRNSGGKRATTYQQDESRLECVLLPPYQVLQYVLQLELSCTRGPGTIP